MTILPSESFQVARCNAFLEGEDVLAHASLDAFRQTYSTVESVANAFRAPMGFNATFVMIADTRSFAKAARSMRVPSTIAVGTH